MDASGNPGTAEFAKALSRNGYPFQYRTLKEAADASNIQHRSDWVLQVAEFPVEVQGERTKIDYILQWQGEPKFRIVECKRANPALSHWCFAKATFVRREWQGDHLFAEVVKCGRYRPAISFAGKKGMALSNSYYIAFDMPLQGKKGDAEGAAGRGAIEQASTQVCRGLYGLVELLATSRPDTKRDWEIVFVPVILTTARLFAAEVDLDATSLITGELNEKDVSRLEEKDWLFYQYSVSSGLQPLRQSTGIITELIDFGEILETRFLRSIAIVQGKHWTEFLSWMSTNFGGPT